ncbi:MAG: lipopolysaccharide assembly protein LptD [Sodalis sp. Fse]|nr:MAG: lipopolysaccharide assembly protein LptD [Sodalis sp. Fse]
MKKYFSTLLASLIWTALYNQHALAKLLDQCLQGIPSYTKPLVTVDPPNQLPVYIQADKAEANYTGTALFSGKVDIKQGNSTLTADQVQLHRQQNDKNESVRTITASGNVNYYNNEIKLKGIKAWVNLNTKDTDVYQGNYQMVGQQGRGNADIMKQRDNNRYTVLENGSFTTCLPGDNSWSVVGSEIIYDRQEQTAEIWNARFKIGKVSIFHSPYLQLPMGDKRRSGFLLPNFKYGSSNGFEFSTPYYINLAPNYDATITPNYISKRSTQIQTEFHYLTLPWQGLIEFDWLPSDRLYNRYHSNDNNSDRWLFYWRHNGIMDKVWRFNIDYTKTSDSDYFDDFNSKYSDNTNGYVSQKFSFGYTDLNWDAVLLYKRFQIFNTSMHNTYSAVPQLDITYYNNYFGLFDFKFFSQAAKFTNINNEYPKTTRLHIYPTIKLPMANHWGNLNIEAKLLMTHYQQKNIEKYNETTNTQRHLKNSVNRILPQFQTNGKIVFEQNIDFSQGYTQTLEPQLQYLYIPYRNQNNIGVYDSTILQTDYTGLFRDRTYSGVDRISSANQLASGITTRIYNDKQAELFNTSIGQIYYFSRPRTGDLTGTWDDYNTTGSVIWAHNNYWRISNQWSIHSCVQYDNRLNNLVLGDAVLEYRRDKDRSLQLNYSYASTKYIEQMLPEITHPSCQQGISQVGITGRWPMIDHWSLTGAYYYDTKANLPTNQLVGVQYNTCCWAVNMGYKRKITGWDNSYNSNKYDNKVTFNIELRGLTNNYNLNTNKMLSSDILPYQQTF